jgi:5-methylcytosine-specific restriction endonuclease McrA
MPQQPPRRCPTCGSLVSARRCPTCQRNRRQRVDAGRPSAASRGYNVAWRNARAAYLQAHPWCSHPACGAPATVVDHVIAHRGDQTLFWDGRNWAPLCARHHSQKTVKHDNGFGQGSKRHGRSTAGTARAGRFSHGQNVEDRWGDLG